MKKNVFFKVFFGSVVWTAACLGLAAVAADKAHEQDPLIYEKVAERVQNSSNMQVSFRSSNDREFAAAEETWSFPTPSERIDLTTVNGDVEIEQGPAGTPLTIVAKGRRHRATPKLLETIATKEVVRLEQPENDGVRKLEITLRVPVDFKGKLSIRTVNGDTEIQTLTLNTFELESVSGDVEIQRASIGEASIKTVSGNVEFDNAIRGKLKLETVSGDCSVKVAEADKTNFKLESLSGEIKNARVQDPAGETFVQVKTMSGDITIL